MTADNLKAAGYGFIVDQARTLSKGSVDPVVQEIAGAVARVRRAVSTGNTLDADTTKVPNSLLDVTVRMAFYNLMLRLTVPLSEDQRQKQRDDNSDLLRISDKQIRVEAPDNPAASGGEMQGQPVPAITERHRKFKGSQEDGTY